MTLHKIYAKYAMLFLTYYGALYFNVIIFAVKSPFFQITLSFIKVNLKLQTNKDF